jgi:Fungal specific transcription factor domain
MQMMNSSDPNSRSGTGTGTSTSISESSVDNMNNSTINGGKSPTNGQGHFHVQGSEARYVGSTHWSAILDNINELKSVIVSEKVNVDGDEDDRDAADADTLFGTGRPPSIERVLQQHLPPRVQVDRRLSNYFNAKYLVLPIIHTYQFQRQYEQFWSDPLGTPPLWLAILFSILCMSATLSKAVGSEPNPPEGGPCQPDSFLIAAAQCLTLGGYTRPRRYVVEALLLFMMCKYIAKLDPSREVGIIFCIASRLAFRMGYHRDPDHFSHFSKFEGEMRRRTWAMCMQFDLMIAFQLGLPNNIPPDSYDTKAPRNLLDSDFDEHMAELPPSRPETEATQILNFVVKSRLMTVFGKICRHTLALQPVPDDEVVTLQAEIDQTYATIPEPLRIRTMAQSFADPAHMIMVRLNCEFLFCKSICVLHRKYMAQGNEFSRNACVKAAMAILGHLIDLHGEIQPGGQLYADRWMLSSITMNDFLLAAIILCLALSMSQKKLKQGQTFVDLQDSRVHLETLKQAHAICLEMGATSTEAMRVANALGIMLSKLEPTLGSKLTLQQQSMDTVREQAQSQSQSSSDLILTPLSLEEASGPKSHMPQMDSFTNNVANYGVLDQFNNILGGTDLDWTAFDQYLVDSDLMDDIGQGWTSTPYRFGQS